MDKQTQHLDLKIIIIKVKLYLYKIVLTNFKKQKFQTNKMNGIVINVK